MVQDNKRFVTVEYVVALAQEMIKQANSRDVPWMREYCYLAAQDLGYSDVDIQTDKIYVKGFKIKKPINFLQPESLYLYDEAGNEYQYNYTKGGILAVVPGRITVSEMDDHFTLSSNASDITYCMLKYYGLPIDEDGNPKFWNHQIQAVISFLRYHWYMRENDRGQFSAVMPYVKGEWETERRKAKSANKMPSMLHAKKIASTWGSMIENSRIKFRQIDGI